MCLSNTGWAERKERLQMEILTTIYQVVILGVVGSLFVVLFIAAILWFIEDWL